MADAEKPFWKNIDLWEKVAIPITVLSATLLYNCSADSRHERDLSVQQNIQQENQKIQENDENQKTCIDEQMKLTDLMCGNNNTQCAVKPGMDSYVSTMVQNIASFCKKGGIPLPALSDSTFAAVAQGSKSVNETVEAKAAFGSNVTPTINVAPANTGVALVTPGIPAPDNSKSADEQLQSGLTPPAAGLAPRVYVQIISDDQRADAATLIGRVNGSTFNGARLIALGPDLVANSRVAKTQLRCTKRADCANAAPLATYLGALLGTAPLPILDLSAKYENSTAARPGHYELWFGPGPVFAGGAG